jgi:uncharacterized membrane protein
MKSNSVRNMVLAAMFAALIFLGTFIIRIPITATNGYIHFGDGFIYITAIVLPFPFAAAAGAIGGFLADMLAGYMAYAPWTAIIKALMGAAVGLLLRHNRFIKRIGGEKNEGESGITGLGAAFLATLIAGIINVGGYFIVECFMYTPAGAIVGVPMNCLQSAFGIVVFFVLAPAFSRALRSIMR